jgi:hypothetical protein
VALSIRASLVFPDRTGAAHTTEPRELRRFCAGPPRS